MLKINVCLLIFNFMISFGIDQHLSLDIFGRGECRINLKGNCNPNFCEELGSVCEARFVRFWDQIAQVDRTLKSCRCLKQSICPLATFGCQNYKELRKEAQKIVRKWTNNHLERAVTMGPRMKGKLNRNLLLVDRGQNGGHLYLDALRHHDLLHGTSKFCCQISEENSKRQIGIGIGSSESFENYYFCPFSKCYLPFIFSIFFSRILY